SNTVAFAEVANGLAPDVASGAGAGDPIADCYEFGGSPSTKVLPAVQQEFLAKDWRSASVPWSGEWRFRGYPWSEGTVWRTWYNHLLPPNSVCWRPGSWWAIVSPASSHHSGGVNAVRLDGSVHFSAESIDPIVWVDLGTRDGLPEEPESTRPVR
ncbi:MAG: DUF1559 domain-containing protein, partial [Bythopirellula sp.]